MTDINSHVQYGVDSVSPSALERVSSIASFAASATRLAADADLPVHLDRLEPLVRALVVFLCRFAALPKPPLDALASALEAASSLAKSRPLVVWSMLQQQHSSGFLPSFSSSVSSVDSTPTSPLAVASNALDGRDALPGSYGNILATQECAQARYPLTAAFLRIVLHLSPSVLVSADADLLLPSVLFVLREIFPHFGRWRFFSSGENPKRESIGQKCLEIFLAIPPDSTAASVVRESLVKSPAGETLVCLLGTGVDVIQAALHSQGDLKHGAGAELTRLVHLAFQVLTSTIGGSEADGGSLDSLPLLSSSSSYSSASSIPNVVSTVASYIFLRYDPALPRLAVILLRQLASACRMSLLASFGGDADVIRDALVRCLKSYTEDVRLKVAIFEFLTSCVRHQPGLIECFLDIQASTTSGPSVSSSRVGSPVAGTSSSSSGGTTAASTATPPPPPQQRSFSPGKNSCIPAMVSLIDAAKQDTFHCPAPLLLAVGDLALALWVGGRETAVDVVGKIPGFWKNVTETLFKKSAVLKSNPEGDVFDVNADSRVRSAVVALGILAIELYNKGTNSSSSSSSSSEFLSVVDQLMKDEKLVLWLGQAAKIAAASSGEGKDPDGKSLNSETAALTLLSSIQRLVLVSTSLKGSFSAPSSLRNKLISTAVFWFTVLVLANGRIC